MKKYLYLLLMAVSALPCAVASGQCQQDLDGNHCWDSYWWNCSPCVGCTPENSGSPVSICYTDSAHGKCCMYSKQMKDCYQDPPDGGYQVCYWMQFVSVSNGQCNNGSGWGTQCIAINPGGGGG